MSERTVEEKARRAEAQRRYYAANQGARLACGREYASAHVAEKRLYDQKRYAADREQKTSYERLRRASDPEKHRALGAARMRTTSGRFTTLKSSAKYRGISVTLTKDEYAAIISSTDCRYCGFPLPEAGTGLDRVDNTKGYEIGNVVPCCKDCNIMRNDRVSSAEMERHLGPAIRILKEERLIGLMVFKAAFQ